MDESTFLDQYLEGSGDVFRFSPDCTTLRATPMGKATTAYTDWDGGNKRRTKSAIQRKTDQNTFRFAANVWDGERVLLLDGCWQCYKAMGDALKKARARGKDPSRCVLEIRYDGRFDYEAEDIGELGEEGYEMMQQATLHNPADLLDWVED